MASKIKFGSRLNEQKPQHQDPIIPTCVECLRPANPNWGSGGAIFCRDCRPGHKDPWPPADKDKTDGR